MKRKVEIFVQCKHPWSLDGNLDLDSNDDLEELDEMLREVFEYFERETRHEEEMEGREFNVDDETDRGNPHDTTGSIVVSIDGKYTVYTSRTYLFLRAYLIKGIMKLPEEVIKFLQCCASDSVEYYTLQNSIGNYRLMVDSPFASAVKEMNG